MYTGVGGRGVNVISLPGKDITKPKPNVISMQDYIVYDVPGSATKITITFDDYADIFNSLVTIYQPYMNVLGSWVIHSSFDSVVRLDFDLCDTNKNGTLDWKNGEIDTFINRLLSRKGLPPMETKSIIKLFHAFDTDNNYKLDFHEARNLAHSLFSAIVYFGTRRGYVVVPGPDKTYADSWEYMSNFVKGLKVNVVDKVVEIPHIHEEDITVEVPEYHHHKLIREVPKIEHREVVQRIDVPEITIVEEIVPVPDWRREERVVDVEQKTIWEKERIVPIKRFDEREEIVEVPVRLPMLEVDRVVEKHTIGGVRPVIHHVKGIPEIHREELIEEKTCVVEQPKVVLVPQPRTENRIKNVTVPHIERVEKTVLVPKEEIYENVKDIDAVDTTTHIRYIPRFEFSGETVHLTLPTLYYGTTVELQEAETEIVQLERQKSDMQVELDLRLKQIGDLQTALAKSKEARIPVAIRKRELVPYVTYSGTTITFDDYADIYNSLVSLYLPHITVLESWVIHSSFDSDVRGVFNECDKNGNGTLDWHNREIDMFINRLLSWKGLPPMGKLSILNLFRAFDTDNNYKLDFHEARNLAHALFSGISYFGRKRQEAPVKIQRVY